jgi:signal peptidase I
MIKRIQQYLHRWKEYKLGLKGKNKKLYILVTTLEDIFVALMLALLVRQFAFQSSMVYSGSMIPTMQVNDFLIVNKLVYKFREPKRSEIVLFKSPHGDKKQFVKRLIGLPGDRIEIKRGVVYINGQQLILPGVDVARDYSFYGPIAVPENSYFFLGDNRQFSADSRYWGFVKEEDLIGKALFTFWPITRMQVLY